MNDVQIANWLNGNGSEHAGKIPLETTMFLWIFIHVEKTFDISITFPLKKHQRSCFSRSNLAKLSPPVAHSKQ